MLDLPLSSEERYRRFRSLVDRFPFLAAQDENGILNRYKGAYPNPYPSLKPDQTLTPPYVDENDDPHMHASAADIDDLLNSVNGWSGIQDSSADAHVEESPTLRKQRRRKTVSNSVSISDVKDRSAAHNEKASLASSHVPHLPSHIRRILIELRGLMEDDFNALCESYVSQTYYPPSKASAVILPRFRTMPKILKAWLDIHVRMKTRVDYMWRNSGPQILRYDPLGKLSPGNERHEAERCLYAAFRVFDKTFAGRDGYHDHRLAGTYHFIPKFETDKWNDDSNFFVTDKEFEDLIEDMDKDKDDPVQRSYVAEHCDEGFEHRGLGFDNEGQRFQKVESYKTVVRGKVILDDLSKPSNLVTGEQGAPKQWPVIKPKDAKCLVETGSSSKITRPLTPSGERHRKIARLDTTPTGSSKSEKGDSAVSSDSFKTACESLQVKDSTPDNELRPIPVYHGPRHYKPNRRTSRSSKAGNFGYDSQEKSTKKVFGVVKGRLEQIEGRGSESSQSGLNSFDTSLFNPRPLLPSPVEATSPHSSQYDTRELVRSPVTPTPLGPRGCQPRSNAISSPQNYRSFGPNPPAPPPAMGTFYPIPIPHAQQSPHFTSNNYHAHAGAVYHFGACDNRIGSGVQTGFAQSVNNGPDYGSNHHSSTQHHMQNHTQYHMQHPIHYSMQHSIQRHVEYQQMYGNNGYTHHTQVSPGNWSSDSTISMISQLNTNPGLPAQSYQPETPSKRGTTSQTEPPSGNPVSGQWAPRQQPVKKSPLSDGRTTHPFDNTPIRLNLPPSSKSTTREKAIVRFKKHKDCAKIEKILQDAAKAAPEKKIMFTETFDSKPTKIILSAPAGSNIRGWVVSLAPEAFVEMSMN